MSKTYNYQIREVAATPRNKRLTDSIQAAAATGGAVFAGGSTPQYWELSTTDADGNALDEKDYFLKPVQGKSLVVPGDMVANATTDEVEGLPVAVDYTITGLFRAKKDGGLIYDTNNGWYVNPDFAGGGGIDEAQLKKYLDSNGYVTNTTLNNKGYLTSINWSMVSNAVYNNTSGLGSGYYLNGNGELKKIAYSELSGLPDLSQFVTLTTSQTITGSKWFDGVGLLKSGPKTNVHIVISAGAGNCINGLTSSEAIGNLYFNYVSSTSYTRIDGSNNFVTSGDVVANSTGAAVSGLPVADASTYGLVKYDNSTIKKNSSGQLYCTVSGGSGGTTVSWGTSSTQYAQLTVAGTTKNVSLNGHTHSYSTVSWSGSLSSGTKIGTLTINGSSYSLYAPSSSGGSSSWNGGTVTDNITISKSGPTLRLMNTSAGGWAIQSASNRNLDFYSDASGSGTKVAYVTTAGAWTKSSDIRLKNVDSPIFDILDLVDNCDVFRFRYKQYPDNIQAGVSAQQIQVFLPEVVSTSEYDDELGFEPLGVDYATLGAVVAIGGCKELHAKIKEQQATIDILQAKLDELTKIVTEMRGGNV